MNILILSAGDEVFMTSRIYGIATRATVIDDSCVRAILSVVSVPGYFTG